MGALHRMVRRWIERFRPVVRTAVLIVCSGALLGFTQWMAGHVLFKAVPGRPPASALTATPSAVAPRQPVKRRTPARTAGPVITATPVGTFVNPYEPVTSKEGIHRITLDQAKTLFDDGAAVFVDARTDIEYELGHIQGALPDFTQGSRERTVKLVASYYGKVMVTYCHGTDCHVSDKAAEVLFDCGARKLCVFFGGWDMWKEAGYPAETGKWVER